MQQFYRSARRSWDWKADNDHAPPSVGRGKSGFPQSVAAEEQQSSSSHQGTSRPAVSSTPWPTVVFAALLSAVCSLLAGTVSTLSVRLSDKIRTDDAELWRASLVCWLSQLYALKLDCSRGQIHSLHGALNRLWTSVPAQSLEDARPASEWKRGLHLWPLVRYPTKLHNGVFFVHAVCAQVIGRPM